VVSNGKSCHDFSGGSEIDEGLVPDLPGYTHTQVNRDFDETGHVPLEQLGICHRM
jgi:hypothetical protein